MHRQTKIVATLGPATEDPQVLAVLLQAGVDTVRVNFPMALLQIIADISKPYGARPQRLVKRWLF